LTLERSNDIRLSFLSAFNAKLSEIEEEYSVSCNKTLDVVDGPFVEFHTLAVLVYLNLHKTFVIAVSESPHENLSGHQIDQYKIFTMS
jgi:hypothetical protein